MPSSQFLYFRIGFTVLLLFSFLHLYSQRPEERKHLSAQLRSFEKTDTNYINALYKFGETYELENNDSAFFWYNKGYALSKKTNYINGQLRYRDYTSILLVYLGKYDDGMRHIDTALELATRNKRKRFQAIEFNLYGTVWQYKFEMNKAAEYYVKAFEMAQQIRDTLLMNAVAGNLSGVFLEIKRFDKAREFSIIGYDLAMATHDTLSVGYGLINLASCDLNELAYVPARSEAIKAIDIARKYADEVLELFAMNNYGSALKGLGKTDSAIMIFEKARSLALHQKIDYHIMFAEQGLGDCYFNKRDYKSAIHYYKEALLHARVGSNRSKQAELYRALAGSYENSGDISNALAFRKQYDQLRDSINIVEQNKNISELEARYQSEKHQRELSEKSLEIEQQKNKASTRLFWLVGISTLFVVAIVVIVQRVKIARTREQSLRNEMQINVLKASENERSRIAKDLHDDVGATLSSIHVYSQAAQMQWNNKREEIPTLIQRISTNSEQMMDKMSDIIWSMNTNQDSGERLAMRIKTFASEVLGSKDIETTFELEDLELLDLTIEARKNLLLIAKEAITNISKYSQAKQVIVRSLVDEQHLHLIIKDDGIGFDSHRSSAGNGLANMKHRSAVLTGSLTINTALGNGTEIILQLPLAKISDGAQPVF